VAGLTNSKTIAIVGGEVFDFKVDGSYTFNFAIDGYLQVKLAGGQNTNVSDAAFSAVEEFDLTGLSALNLTGITFKEADASVGWSQTLTSTSSSTSC
jgi:hypothetical protein